MLAAAIAVIGLALTGVVTWAAFRANDNSNDALLHLEVRQVATALSTSLPALQSELTDAVNEANLTNSTAAFQAFAGKIAPAGFTSVSLWRRTATGGQLVAVVGAQPQLVKDGKSGSFFAHLHPSNSLQVSALLPGQPPRLGFAEYPTGDSNFIVYAESELPAHRRLVIPSNSPFGQLNYALYLGPHATPSQLIASTVPLPIQGLRARASVAFGNTSATVVATPRVQLSSSLSGNLPWIVLGAGIVITLASVATIEFVGRRRRQAEMLARELRRLHAEQRSIATTLQHALLPESVPEVPGLELAAHYLPGTQGVEVGGDWYDFVPLDNERLVFVVGDVSGRGVRAASVMASLRFAGHGFALEGHPPHVIIERLRTLLDLESNGYFATVLCGLVDVARHELLLSNAGHPPPILCSPDACSAVSVPPAPPVGVSTRSPDESTRFTVPPLSTIVAYTDGLIERREETLNSGIQRLERAAEQQQEHLDALLESIISDLTKGSPSDDVAVIGVRWLK
ncbi:MAG: PP2C family protein-serine/threonine phosphatase [Acidimicrobiales bacterium]